MIRFLLFPVFQTKKIKSKQIVANQNIELKSIVISYNEIIITINENLFLRF